jgi:hypothetical protein
MLYFYINGEKKGKTGPFVGDGTSGKSGGYKEMGQRVNMFQIFCIHVCK